jgi:hypothetical protein
VQATTGVNATGNKPHYYSLNRHAENFGYVPALNSIQGLVVELIEIFQAIKL